jgi:hypothetical protein
MSKKTHYLGVAGEWNLNLVCIALSVEFGHHIYLVGSCLERPDFRDVDVRCILPDDEYDRKFPRGHFDHQLLRVAISEWLVARTGLPIDFDFQRRTEANEQFKGRSRSALGIYYAEGRP